MKMAEAGQSHGLEFTPDKSASRVVAFCFGITLTNCPGGGDAILVVWIAVWVVPRVLQILRVGLTRLLGRGVHLLVGADAVLPVILPVLDLELLQ